MNILKSNDNKWIEWLTIAIILIVGIFIRYQNTFSSELPPGINGLYFSIQIRSILETGAMGIPDFPLLFYFESLFALLVSYFSDLDNAILTTSLWFDTVIPVLIVVPLYWFINSFSKSNQKNRILSLLIVGLIAVSNSSITKMAVNFQKNAISLPLGFSFIFFLYKTVKDQKDRDLILSCFFLGCVALSHIGVFVLVFVIAGLMLFVLFIVYPQRKQLSKITLALVITAALFLSITYLFDSTRVTTLIDTFTNPTKLFPFSMIPIIPKRIYLMRETGVSYLGLVSGLTGIVILALNRNQTVAAEKGLMISTSVTALLFSLPIFNIDWPQRLTMMAFIPGLIPLVYLVTRFNWGWVVGLMVLILVASDGIANQWMTPQQILAKNAYLELVEFRDEIPAGNNLVYARHGLEWWVSWTMETKITNQLSLAIDAFKEYDNVFVVEQTNSEAFENISNVEWMNSSSGDKQSTSWTHQIISPDGTVKEISMIRQGEYFRLSVITETYNNEFLSACKDYSIAGQINIVTREEWGANETKYNSDKEYGIFDPVRNPDGILCYQGSLSNWLHTAVIHQSAMPLDMGVLDIQRYHLSQGYADIGYHFFIDQKGTLYEGRPLNMRGAHTQGFNTGTIGIVLPGNMDLIFPTENQIQTLERLLLFLKETYGVNNLAAHRDFNPSLTIDPGVNLYSILPQIAKDVELHYGVDGYTR